MLYYILSGSFDLNHTAFIHYLIISNKTFKATESLFSNISSLGITCPLAAHPSFDVNWKSSTTPHVSPTQPICLLSPDNQSHDMARGNKSPGHVSLRSLSCNRICSWASLPPPPITINPPLFLSIHLYTSYNHVPFLSAFLCCPLLIFQRRYLTHLHHVLGNISSA